MFDVGAIQLHNPCMTENRPPSTVNLYQKGASDTRPWGKWRTTGIGILSDGLSYCDKVIDVNPGAKLSVQRHFYRREEWHIEKGLARIWRGAAPQQLIPLDLGAGGTAHIQKGEWHSLENTTKEPLQIRERQIGIYLSEDDIERGQDAYGRGTNEKALLAIHDNVTKLGLVWPDEAE
jgi:mannose-6-phosphate isomerase-like protein (cupin superfamily)